MLRLLYRLISDGIVTNKKTFCPSLEEGVRGLPSVTPANCVDECQICVDVCPNDAISLSNRSEHSSPELDLGACITCGLCISGCPGGTIVNNPSTKTARYSRKELILSEKPWPATSEGVASGSFARSASIRVVSTGCTACDLEIAAAGNPIFDMERFGVRVVASPRFADILMITGPVPKAMHDALKSCYEAMAEPRAVIACGTCAISGGMHKSNYSEANGADGIVPVDVFIPGCPPNPWSVIYGVSLAMKKLAQQNR